MLLDRGEELDLLGLGDPEAVGEDEVAWVAPVAGSYVLLSTDLVAPGRAPFPSGSTLKGYGRLGNRWKVPVHGEPWLAVTAIGVCGKSGQ